MEVCGEKLESPGTELLVLQGLEGLSRFYRYMIGVFTVIFLL